MNVCFLAALYAGAALNPKGWINQYTKDVNLQGFLYLGLGVSKTAGGVWVLECRCDCCSRKPDPKPSSNLLGSSSPSAFLPPCCSACQCSFALCARVLPGRNRTPSSLGSWRPGLLVVRRECGNNCILYRDFAGIVLFYSLLTTSKLVWSFLILKESRSAFQHVTP